MAMNLVFFVRVGLIVIVVMIAVLELLKNS